MEFHSYVKWSFNTKFFIQFGSQSFQIFEFKICTGRFYFRPGCVVNQVNIFPDCSASFYSFIPGNFITFVWIILAINIVERILSIPQL